MRNAMSVDVEDWFQVGAFENVIDRKDWNGLELRVESNTDAVLDLFAHAGVVATFFTLGWVAARFPALMRRIADAGHEVASHGWDHARVHTLTPEAFRADLRQARTALEDASGQRVGGYRAPSFSIDARTPWAHAILAEEGYDYSSSVAPVKHDHYGWVGTPRTLYRPVADADMIEWPITLARILGRDVPAGGGFFRLLPNRVVEAAVTRVNLHEAHPAMFYFHPWEIDPGQPRVRNAPMRSRLRHYSRLSAMTDKLRTLLGNHEWGRTDRIVAAQAPALL